MLCISSGANCHPWGLMRWSLASVQPCHVGDSDARSPESIRERYLRAHFGMRLVARHWRAVRGLMRSRATSWSTWCQLIQLWRSMPVYNGRNGAKLREKSFENRVVRRVKAQCSASAIAHNVYYVIFWIEVGRMAGQLLRQRNSGNPLQNSSNALRSHFRSFNALRGLRDAWRNNCLQIHRPCHGAAASPARLKPTIPFRGSGFLGEPVAMCGGFNRWLL